MKIVLNKKSCCTDAVKIHVDPPPINLIKSKNDAKWENYCVKIKLRRDPTSEKSDLYEFKMSLFDNGNTEEFLLFVWNFQMNLKASGELSTSKNIQYLVTLLRREALRQIYMFSVEVGDTTTTHLNSIILGLGT